MRADLLALTIEDLELISNRGTVKRARSEIATGIVNCTSLKEENAGTTFQWSDGSLCSFAEKKTVHKATCTCDSVGICRHIIRSILYYQQLYSIPQAGQPNKDLPVHEPVSEIPNSNAQKQIFDQAWSPGEITDQHLSQHCSSATLARARKLLEDGLTVELIVSNKPIARFISLSHSVRFLVPTDIRYALCDCRDQAPCLHAVLSVLAFRLLGPEQTWALLYTGKSNTVQAEVLKELEDSIKLFIYAGFNSIDTEPMRLLRKAQGKLEDNHYYYLCDILEEILQARERSLAGDALFSPYGLVILIAELIARIDAANHANNPIPSSVITGEKANRPSEVGTVNLIGLGTQVIDSLRRITIISYFQDNNTGSLVTMAREHSLSGELVSYAELANRPFSKTLSLATLGLSRVIASGGRITASRCYAPGRSPLNSNPQNYQWESVRTPIRVENFAELSVQLSAEFPRYLSGRQAGRHLKVCKIQAQGRPYYDQGQQLLSIPLLDEQKEPAILSIPYRSRASFGFEKLVEKLSDEDNQIRFISGIWSMAGNHLSVLPVTIIFEKDGSRWALQPDIETGEHIAGFGEVKASGLHRQSPAKEILNELGVLFTTGLSKAKADDLRTLRLLQQQTEAEGCLLLSKRLEHFLKIALSSIERKNLDALTGSALSLALVSFVMEETAG